MKTQPRLWRRWGIAALALISAGVAVSARANTDQPEKRSVPAEFASQVRHSSAGQKYTVVTYAVPTADAVPHIIAIDAADQVWFSESGGRFAGKFLDVPAQSKIGRIDGNGSISEWTFPDEGTSPMGLTFDPQGNMWIAERLANRITRMLPDGTFQHFSIPTANAWPTGIALDSKGGVWFTETKGNRIGKVDPATGKIDEFAFAQEGMSATGIAIDADDRVWAAGRDANVIAKFDPVAAKFEYFTLPTPNAKPCGIVVDAQNRVWFTQRNAGKLATITKDGAIQEFSLKERTTGPFLPIVDRQGNIWFSQIWSNKIAKFDPIKREFEEFPVADDLNHIAGIAMDSRGNIWFASQTTNKVGVLSRQNLAYFAPEPDLAQPPRLAVYDADRCGFTSFEVPTKQSIPGIVEADPTDTVWFTQMGGGFVSPSFPPGPPGSKIGFIRDGRIGELATPTAESGPTSMAIDPTNGDVWVTLRSANKVALVRNDKVTEFDLPVAGTFPVGITVDHAQNVWVALSTVGALARRTPSGDWRVLNLPDRKGNPRTIYADRQGRIWYTEKDGNRLGLVDQAAWTVREWKIPTRVAWPLSLAEDEVGNVWFAEMRADKLARFDLAAERFEEYRLPAHSAPFKILFDKTKRVFWISTVFGNSVLRFDIDSTRVVAAYRIPNEGVWLGGITRARDGCFWVTEQFGNRVDRLCLPQTTMGALQ
ncbi:Vgb family protein [Bradyrhizobium barranii]